MAASAPGSLPPDDEALRFMEGRPAPAAGISIQERPRKKAGPLPILPPANGITAPGEGQVAAPTAPAGGDDPALAFMEGRSPTAAPTAAPTAPAAPAPPSPQIQAPSAPAFQPQNLSPKQLKAQLDSEGLWIQNENENVRAYGKAIAGKPITPEQWQDYQNRVTELQRRATGWQSLNAQYQGLPGATVPKIRPVQYHPPPQEAQLAAIEPALAKRLGSPYSLAEQARLKQGYGNAQAGLANTFAARKTQLDADAARLKAEGAQLDAIGKKLQAGELSPATQGPYLAALRQHQINVGAYQGTAEILNNQISRYSGFLKKYQNQDLHLGMVYPEEVGGQGPGAGQKALQAVGDFFQPITAAAQRNVPKIRRALMLTGEYPDLPELPRNLPPDQKAALIRQKNDLVAILTNEGQGPRGGFGKPTVFIDPQTGERHLAPNPLGLTPFQQQILPVLQRQVVAEQKARQLARLPQAALVDTAAAAASLLVGGAVTEAVAAKLATRFAPFLFESVAAPALTSNSALFRQLLVQRVIPQVLASSAGFAAGGAAGSFTAGALLAPGTKGKAPTLTQRAAFGGQAAAKSVVPSALIGAGVGALFAVAGTVVPAFFKSRWSPETGPAYNEAFTQEAVGRARTSGVEMTPEEVGRFSQRFMQIQRAPQAAKPALWRALASDWNGFIEARKLPGVPPDVAGGTPATGSLGPARPELGPAPFGGEPVPGPRVTTPAGSEWDLRTRPVTDLQELHGQLGQAQAAGTLTPEQQADYARLQRFLDGYHEYQAQQRTPPVSPEAKSAITEALTTPRLQVQFGIEPLLRTHTALADAPIAPILQEALTDQQQVVAQTINRSFAPPDHPLIQGPRGPLTASPFRQLTPEQFTGLPADTRRALLLQDLNNSIQVVHPGALPYFVAPPNLKGEDDLRALADRYYGVASGHLSLLYPPVQIDVPPPAAAPSILNTQPSILTRADLAPGATIQFPNGLKVRLTAPLDAGGQTAWNGEVLEAGSTSYVPGSTAPLATANLLAGGTLLPAEAPPSTSPTSPGLAGPSTGTEGAAPGISAPTGPSLPTGTTSLTAPGPPGRLTEPPTPPSTSAPAGGVTSGLPGDISAGTSVPVAPKNLRPGAKVRSIGTEIAYELEGPGEEAGKWAGRVTFKPEASGVQTHVGDVRQLPEKTLLDPTRFDYQGNDRPEVVPSTAPPSPAPPPTTVTEPSAPAGEPSAAEPTPSVSPPSGTERPPPSPPSEPRPARTETPPPTTVTAAPPPPSATPPTVSEISPPSTTETTPSLPPSELPAPIARLIDALLERIDAQMTRDEPIFHNNPELEAFAGPILGGSRAAGSYDAQTVYNALEAAVNRYVAQQQFGKQEAKDALAHVTDLQNALPTQTIRAGDKDALQQFSTPPTLALVAAYALQAKPGENLLEPSAGTGSLLAMAESLYGTGHKGEADTGERLLHGTNRPFERFGAAVEAQTGIRRQGHFFTEDPRVAARFAQEQGGEFLHPDTVRESLQRYGGLSRLPEIAPGIEREGLTLPHLRAIARQYLAEGRAVFRFDRDGEPIRVQAPEELTDVDLDGGIQAYRPGHVPRVIEATVYGRTLDLRGPDWPADLLTRLQASRNKWDQALADTVSGAAGAPSYNYLAVANSPVLEAYAAEHGYGKIRVRDHSDSGGQSIYVPDLGYVGDQALGKTIANEIDPERRAIVGEYFAGETHAVDGRYLNAMLPPGDYDLILMNPPFSAAKTQRVQNANVIGFDHVAQALKRLKPGGRLVAILGQGAALDRPTAAPFWQQVRGEYTLRANIGLPGSEYRKYGTTFANQLVIIDAAGPTSPDAVIWTDTVTSPAAAIEGLDERGILERATGAAGPAPVGAGPAGTIGERGGEGGATPAAGRGERGGGEPRRREGVAVPPEPGAPGETVPGPVAGAAPGEGGAGGEPGDGPAPAGPVPGARPGAGGGRNQPDRQLAPAPGGELLPQPPAAEPTAAAEQAPEPAPAPKPKKAKAVAAPEAVQPAIRQDVGSQYVTFQAPFVLEGRPHPAVMVETKSLAAVDPPAITVTHRLKEETLQPTEALAEDYARVTTRPKPDKDSLGISQLQLEENLYAQQRFELTLPDGTRAGYLTGGGTGLGKGRLLASIAANMWGQGVRRIYWLSAQANLINNARDDLAAIGYGHIAVKKLNDFPGGEPIPDSFEGIIFSTYSTLIQPAKSGSLKDQRRRYQMEQWLAAGNAANHEGDRGEGALILMDESHAMKNAVKIGQSEPSDTAIEGMKLQKNLPRGRIVYASATAMTDIENMAYLTRLGMWGPGTPWPGGFRDFAQEMSDRSKLEMIARDMKARGAYLAREISYEDPEERPEKSVGIEQLEHTLTGEDERIYNLVADAWQVVLQNMSAAIEITGNSPQAKKNAMTAFWGQHQQFFRRFLTALKLPTLFADIDRQRAGDLDNPDPEKRFAPRSVIISLIGTGDAATKRAVGKAIANEGELDDLDLTPIAALIRLVERSFPTRLYIEDIGPDGRTTIKVPAEDADGNPVHDPEALALRERLLERLAAITEEMPGNPLDEILYRYGHNNVAELTSREYRIEPNKDGKPAYVRRGGSKASVEEMERFNRGDKRIAVISSSASVGISLHAGLNFENQDRRVQYMFELSWSADKQMQANGRSHRSNQKSAPIFVPVATNAGGEVRFAASIARRLASMGALTRGQRAATGAGGALDQYDYENQYGRAALSRLYNSILGGQGVPGLADPRQALRDMGLLKTNQNGMEYLPDEQLEHIPHFFNRLLALRIDQQNPLFEAFDARFRRLIEVAKASKEFDAGVEDIRGENIREAAPSQVVYTDPVTSAAATYHHVVADEPTTPVTLADLDRVPEVDRQGFFRRNSDQKLLYVTHWDSPATPNRIISPASMYSAFTSTADLARNFTRIPDNEQIGARRLWEEAVAKVPPFQPHHYHLLTGAVIGVWDRLRGSGQTQFAVRRAKLPDGTTIVGIAMGRNYYKRILRALGASAEGVNAADLYQSILDGETIELTGGLKLEQGTAGGQKVVRIHGVGDDLRRDLSRQGFPQERIETSYRYRIWVPADPVRGPELLGQLLQRFPPLETGAVAVAAPAVAGVPSPRRRGLAVVPPTQVPLYGVPEGGVPFPTLRWLETAASGLSVQFQRLAQAGLPPEAAERAHDFGVLLWPELVTPEGPAFLGGLSAPVYDASGEEAGRAVYVNPFPPMYAPDGSYQGLKGSPDPIRVADSVLTSMLHELAHQVTEEEGEQLQAAMVAIEQRLGPERLQEVRDGIERLLTSGSGKLTPGYLAAREKYYVRARADRRPPPALRHEGTPDHGRALGQVVSSGGKAEPAPAGGDGGEPAGGGGSYFTMEDADWYLNEARMLEGEVRGMQENYRQTQDPNWLKDIREGLKKAKDLRAEALSLRRHFNAPTSAKDEFLKSIDPTDPLGMLRSPVIDRNRARVSGALTGHPLDLVGFRQEGRGGRIPGTGVFYGVSPHITRDYVRWELKERDEPFGEVIGPLRTLTVDALSFDNPLVINGGKQGLMAVLHHLPFSAGEKQAIRAAERSSKIPHSTLDKAIAKAAVRAGFDGILYRKKDIPNPHRKDFGGPVYFEQRWDSVIVDLREPAMRPAPKLLFQMINSAGPPAPEPERKPARTGEGHRTELAEFPDPGLETQVVEAALPKPPPFDWLLRAFTTMPGLFVRDWPFLPQSDPALAELRARFTHLDKAWGRANMNGVLNLSRIYGELNRFDQSLYRRCLIALDMEEEVGTQTQRLLDRGVPPDRLPGLIALPQGDGTPEQKWTPAKATEMADWARAELAKPENAAVSRALDTRKLVFNDVLSRLSAAQQAVSGKPLTLNRREWFHHMINDFAEAERERRSGGQPLGRVRPAFAGYLLRREGSLLNYNTEDIAVEMSWLPGALYNTYTYEFMAWVENRYNAKKELMKAALAINFANLMDLLDQAAEEMNAKKKRGEPITGEDLYRRRFNAPIAEGFWRLGWLCRNHPDWLPGHDDDRWEDLINEMAVNFDFREDAAALMSAEPEISPESQRQFFNWLQWLLQPPQAGQAGSGAAAQIFRGLRERSQKIKAELGLEYVTWRDLLHRKIGDFDFTGYRAWQPKEGSAIWGAWAVRDRVAQMVLEAESSGTGLALNLSPDDLRRVKVMGGRKPEWVLPKAVADQLDNFKNPYLPAHPALTAVRKASGTWKQWTLLNPFHFVGYNLRNELTDAEMLSFNPDARHYVRDATRMLTDFLWRKQLPAPDLQEWLDLGGQTSTLQASEAGPTGGNLDMLSHLNEPPGLWDRTGGRIMNAARVSTDWREAILRLAMYLSYRDQMLADPEGRPPNYGASGRAAIDAIGDLNLRAWVLSNDLMGPYDRVPQGYKLLRTVVPAPFLNWKIINTRRQLMLLNNEIFERFADWVVMRMPLEAGGGGALPPGGPPPLPPTGGGGPGSEGESEAERRRRLQGELGKIKRLRAEAKRRGLNWRWVVSRLAHLSVGLLFAIFRYIGKANLLNAIEAGNNWVFHRDEEEHLPPWVRYRPHISLGHIPGTKLYAYIDRTSGVGDTAGDFGLDNWPGYYQQIRAGRMSIWEALRNTLVQGPFQAGLNQLGPPKQVYEFLLRRKLFPDADNPREITDRFQYVADQLSLGKTYQVIRSQLFPPGIPHHLGKLAPFVSMLGITYYHPGEVAYGEMRETADQWAQDKGFGELAASHGRDTERAEAAYWVKRAAKVGDLAAVHQFLVQYWQLGRMDIKVTDDQSFALSLKHTYPIYKWPPKQRTEFLQSLDQGEQQRWRDMLWFMQQTYVPELKTSPAEMKRYGHAPIEQFDEWLWGRIESGIDSQSRFEGFERTEPKAYKAKQERQKAIYGE